MAEPTEVRVSFRLLEKWVNLPKPGQKVMLYVLRQHDPKKQFLLLSFKGFIDTYKQRDKVKMLRSDFTRAVASLKEANILFATDVKGVYTVAPDLFTVLKADDKHYAAADF